MPWILSSRPGRTWLLAKANGVLAPGKIELATLELSWFRATRMSGVVLRDREGDGVVAAPRAMLDRTLWQILRERPHFGTLRLEGAFVDVERSADGRIDLIEAIRPVLGRDPNTALTIEVDSASRLRIRSPGLPQPIEAEHLRLTLNILPAPGPLEWRVKLANGDLASPESSLESDGEFDVWAEREGRAADMDLRVRGHSWPWSISRPSIAAAGRFDGELAVRRELGRLALTGDAALQEVALTGSALSGDRLKLDRIKGVWDVSSSDDGWTIRKCELDSVLASLKAEGAVNASAARPGSARLTGQVELAGLAAQVPNALRLRKGITLERGTADLSVELSSQEGGPALDVLAKVSDLRASDHGRPFTLHDSATLTARFRQPRGVLAIERFTAETPYLTGEARETWSRD
jgi:translocation and assembly module TamB